jgi:ADP-ribose diphosphatase
MTHVTHVVLARDLYPSRLPGDEPEQLEVVPWALDRLPELTARADCTEGRTIAALYIARDFLAAESRS